MKNAKNNVWTTPSQGSKSSTGKMRLPSRRRVYSSNNGFDAALLQLGIRISAEQTVDVEQS